MIIKDGTTIMTHSTNYDKSLADVLCAYEMPAATPEPEPEPEPEPTPPEPPSPAKLLHLQRKLLDAAVAINDYLLVQEENDNV